MTMKKVMLSIAVLACPVGANAAPAVVPVSAVPQPVETQKMSPELQAGLAAIESSYVLADKRQFVQAVAGFDKIIAQNRAATSTDLQLLAIHASIAKAEITVRQQRPADSLALLEDAISRLPTYQEPVASMLMAEAMMTRMGVLYQLKRFDVAAEQGQTFVDLFAEVDNQDIQRNLISVINLRVDSLCQIKDFAGAEAALSSMINKLKNTRDEGQIFDTLTTAVILVPFRMEEAGNSAGAADAYGRALDLVNTMPTKPEPELVARLLNLRGGLLAKLHRDDQAMALFQQVIDKNPNPKDPPVIGQVARSRNWRASLFARRRDTDKTITELRGILAVGRTINVGEIVRDPDYRPLMRDPKFTQFLRSHAPR